MNGQIGLLTRTFRLELHKVDKCKIITDRTYMMGIKSGYIVNFTTMSGYIRGFQYINYFISTE